MHGKAMSEIKVKYPTIFHLISDVCAKAGISCILVGGFALNYYKVSRQTADVDFLITKENFKKIEPLLQKAGYEAHVVREAFTRLKGDSCYLMDVDFLFVDKETFSKIIEDSKNISIGGQGFIVPSLMNLIALKMHSLKYNPKIRENKDLPDIIDLIRINRLDYKGREFKELCLKYGTKEIYDKISERI